MGSPILMIEVNFSLTLSQLSYARFVEIHRLHCGISMRHNSRISSTIPTHPPTSSSSLNEVFDYNVVGVYYSL